MALGVGAGAVEGGFQEHVDAGQGLAAGVAHGGAGEAGALGERAALARLSSRVRTRSSVFMAQRWAAGGAAGCFLLPKLGGVDEASAGRMSQRTSNRNRVYFRSTSHLCAPPIMHLRSFFICLGLFRCRLHRSCREDYDNASEFANAQLPPYSETGANTMGCQLGFQTWTVLGAWEGATPVRSAKSNGFPTSCSLGKLIRYRAQRGRRPHYEVP